ncbi:hypothetical protein P280DRAFT_522886 [Massarina eburnea CBS 473.64]|uniref:Uncharacterized protein n=1 Tax=Massarina eburnea CBS 473.64 TaxID=1395130 RepID=A0A6A6RJR3_9PLEO|nr:hypothetical protein P280DRAFT_522886 [Massarina eburnea CBS 473.64]
MADDLTRHPSRAEEFTRRRSSAPEPGLIRPRSRRPLQKDENSIFTSKAISLVLGFFVLWLAWRIHNSPTKSHYNDVSRELNATIQEIKNSLRALGEHLGQYLDDGE